MANLLAIRDLFTNRTSIPKGYEQAIVDAFADLQLPLPEQDEIYTGESTVLFNNYAGCVVRLSDKSKTPLVRHPHLIRPLGSIDLGKRLRLDIQYGRQNYVSVDDAATLYHNAKADGLVLTDIIHHRQNAFYIPTTHPDFPRGFPVAYDPNKVKRLNETVRTVQTMLTKNVIDVRAQTDDRLDDQDALYADLRNAFYNAWNKDTGKADPQAMRDFWQACYGAKLEGRLACGWNDYVPFQQKAARYETRFLASSHQYLSFGI